MQPDRTDFAILRELRKNARLPNKTLAERIGVAPSTVLERVRRLCEAGVIVGYHAELEPRAVGIGLQAMISLQLAQHSRSEVTAFNDHLHTLPEVLSFYHIAGAHDFLVHVAVRDTDHLRDFVLDAFTTRPEVARVETHVIYSSVRNMEMPMYACDAETGNAP